MWHATARRRAARTTHTDTRCTIRIQIHIQDTSPSRRRAYRHCTRHFTRRTVVCAARPSGAVGAVYIHAHNNHKRPRTRARHQYSHIIQRFGQRSRMHVYTTGICAPLRLSTRSHIPYHQHSRLPCCYDGKVFLLEALVHLDHRRSRRGGRHGLASVSPLAFPLARVDVCARAG